MMFAQILKTHWTFTRTLLMGFAVLSFTLPVLIWRVSSIGSSRGPSALVLMDGFAGVGPAIAMFAIIGAFAFAAYPWGIDHETRHVYPLSLPLPWARYVAMRWSAGALLLIIPTVALWLGSVFAVALTELPAVLHAYPGALALRYLIAMLLAYSATFALQYLAGRSAPTAVLILLIAISVPLVTLVALGQDRVLDAIFSALTEWPGPLAIFAEPWKLIDV